MYGSAQKHKWRANVLPLFIAGALGVICLTGFSLARECSCCKKRLKWTHSCLCCEKITCSECGTEMSELFRGGTQLRARGFACSEICKGRVKRQDRDNIEKHDAELERLRKRADRISKVRLVSVNFSGPQKPVKGVRIETGWHTEKHIAEESAREKAVDLYDTDTVWYVKTISEKFPGTSPKGRPYYYRQWMVTGEV